MENILSGNLIIIGGAEDKEGKKEILKRVCDSIDKEKDILVIATIATEYPKEVAAKYKEVFGNLNVRNIKVLDIAERCDAYEEGNVNIIRESALIFLLVEIN
ncbi:cyanophycinase [Clostridium saccharoperbutylacetonicum]|nr:cyanophycinase [Clostridium saccharoperbutylacetonicum]